MRTTNTSSILSANVSPAFVVAQVVEYLAMERAKVGIGYAAGGKVPFTSRFASRLAPTAIPLLGGSTCHLLLTFLQWRLYEAWDQGQPLRSLADVIHQHRVVHARETLISARQQALQWGSIEPVLQRFIAGPVLA